jgi:hypothetical protein
MSSFVSPAATLRYASMQTSRAFATGPLCFVDTPPTVSRLWPSGPGPGPQELPTFNTRMARFWPNELPEGGEGGGGVIPRPRGEINELPIDFTRFLQEVSQLSTRLTQLETRLTADIQVLAQRINELKR